MRNCDNCGTENDDASIFCVNCGTKLGSPQSQPVQAPRESIPSQRGGVGLGGRYTAENMVLKCSLCDNQDFARDEGRLDSKWGFTSFKVVILTCRRCGHVELFNKGRSIFDFD